MNFFGYGLVPFLCKDPLSLSDGWKGWGGNELMHYDLWIDPEHILIAPDEDVQVVP